MAIDAPAPPRTSLPAPSPLRTVARWGATFLAFPIGGLIAVAPGPVDSPLAALFGGAVVGAVLGTAQALALRQRPVRLAIGSAAGLAVGVALGSSAVSFGTTAGDLAVQGAVSGLALGLAQLPVLRTLLGRAAWLWPLLTAVAWTVGWLTTEAAGIDVEAQYAAFGASGALVATALTALLAVPAALRRRPA